MSTLSLGCALLFGAVEANASAATAKPLRVGPVQNYGALGTSGSKIISLSTNKQVMLRGMSMFWSDATGIQYYNKEVLNWAVSNLKIDVIRYAMGVHYYDSQGGTSNALDDNYSYYGNPDMQKSKIDLMVEAAIENDIYIIIDWHSHRAENEQSDANAFFKEMATKYKDVPNIIWEVYNEPVTTGISTIASYANTVIGSIRNAGSPNLALVGTPNWSQMTAYGGVNQTNVAYVFHFYAASHSVSSYSGNVKNCMNAGNAVFISEWGTTSADGSGSTNTSESSNWESFMETNRISNCNWSLRQNVSTVGDASTEASAMFDGSAFLTTQAALSSAGYTTSGSHVKQYLTSHASSWADSLVAGKNSGSCAFSAATLKETAGSASSVFKSGCSYTSSDESVVTSSGNIVAAGIAIMTGNDGSQSVITVEQDPSQTLAGFEDFSCFISGSCTKSKTIKDLDQDGNLEVIASTTGATNEGSTVTITSLNPEIVTVKKATCSNSVGCYGSTKGSSIQMFQFTGTMGEAKIVATAAAVTGYRAMNDTITITYTKAGDKLTSGFKSQTVAKGSTTANVFPDTTYYGKAAVTYTFDGEATSPYLSKVGSSLVAGNEDAIVTVVAKAPESAQRTAFEGTITIIVGDSATAAAKGNVIEAIATIVPVKGITAQFKDNGIILDMQQGGNVTVDIFSALGRTSRNTVQLDAVSGSNWIPVEGLGAGSYMVRVKQGSNIQYFKWNRN